MSGVNVPTRSFVQQGQGDTERVTRSDPSDHCSQEGLVITAYDWL